MEDVLAYLHSKGIRTKRATGENIHCACFYHGEAENDRGRLYINIDPSAEIPGLHTCFVCGERGSLNKIKKHFGDPIDTGRDEPNLKYSSVYQALQRAANYYHERLLERPEKIEWLQSERGLTIETIKKHKLGWADGKLSEHFAEAIASGKSNFTYDNLFDTHLFVKDGARLGDFLKNQITIPYVSFGSVITIRGKDINGKYVTPPGVKTRLFNTDSLLEADEAVICEGEFDALIAEQFGYAAVGVPGAGVWQESFNELFSKLKRVIAVFDNDSAGRRGLEKVRENLGHRVRTVTIPQITGPEDHNDLSDWVLQQGKTKLDFEALISKADGGLLITVDDAYHEHTSLQGTVGLKVGFEMIDLGIRPGLLPAQLLVIEAKTGTGKTISLLNIFHRMAMEQPDTKVLFISLEQTRGDWFERARRIWAFYNRDLIYPSSDSEHDLATYSAEVDRQTLNFWRNRIMMVDKNRVLEEELHAAVQDYEAAMGALPDLIAVDYLGYWARAFKGRDNYERTTEAVMSAKALAKDWRVPLITPSQINRGAEFGREPEVDDARDSGAVEETADFVFMMWAPDSQKGKEIQERTGEVLLKIGKSRHGGVGLKQKLQFSPVTLALVPVEDPQNTVAAKRELDYQTTNKGLTWEKAIWLHHRQAR